IVFLVGFGRPAYPIVPLTTPTAVHSRIVIVHCGSVLSPTYGPPSFNATVQAFQQYNSRACQDAFKSRRVTAWIFGIAGGVIAVVGFVMLMNAANAAPKRPKTPRPPVGLQPYPRIGP